MKSYWNFSVFLSVAIHTAVFLGVPAIMYKNAPFSKKKQVKEIEIIPQELENFPEEPLKEKPRTLEKEPPPYLNNLTKKVLLDENKKIALDKIKTLDENVRKAIFSKLPAEKELKKNPAYMDYYHLIREKIKTNAYTLYESKRAGEVFLTFIILKSGELDSIFLNENSNREQELVGIALKSIEYAAPFPPFPNELDYQKLQFNISIYFKNN